MAEPTQAEVEAAAKELYEHFTDNFVAGWDDIATAGRGPYRLAARDALRAADEVRGGIALRAEVTALRESLASAKAALALAADYMGAEVHGG